MSSMDVGGELDLPLNQGEGNQLFIQPVIPKLIVIFETVGSVTTPKPRSHEITNACVTVGTSNMPFQNRV